MTFKAFISPLLSCCLVLQLAACSDEAKETALVNLHTTAAQDVVSLQFPADTETVISVNSQTAFSVLGMKSNGVDSVNLDNEIEWSLSASAQSSINSNGVITAAPVAETFTVTATLGVLSSSIEVSVSDAKFDQVVSLDAQPISLEMCQSIQIQPQARYIDTSSAIETRKLDNTLIDSIEWIILNASDLSPSQSAYIETVNNVTTLHSLAAADLIVRARATSAYSGNLVTSADINQSIGNGLDSIKLCYSTANDYASCSVSSPHVEQDQDISFIAIGNYASSSSPYQNITRRTKWGLSNNFISAILSQDLQQITVTGEQELQTSTLSYACGEVQESISAIDVAQGVILSSDVNCASNCQQASTVISVDQLSVSLMEVTANATALTHNEALTLATAPAQIELITTVTYSNNEEEDITTNSSLVDTIISIDGQADVIEKVTGTAGTYTVINSGTAKIQLVYRGETFIAVIEIP